MSQAAQESGASRRLVAGAGALATALRAALRPDNLFRWLTGLCAGAVVLLLAGIALQLAWHALPSIRRFGLAFFISPAWNQITGEFGAATSIFGTVMSTAIAMVIAVPLGLVIALMLVELAPAWLSQILGTGIELLAAVPSIIFGMWGIFVFAPFMQTHIQPLLAKHLGALPLFQGPPLGVGIFTAGVILSLMILPYITAVAKDVFKMVPAVVKESSHGMGATTWEVMRSVTIRYGMQGVLGAVFLGLGRAVGETMAVTFVIGNSNTISPSLFAAGNSIASRMANEFQEAEAGSMHLSALVELGLVLFLINVTFQVIAHLWLRRIDRAKGERVG